MVTLMMVSGGAAETRKDSRGTDKRAIACCLQTIPGCQPHSVTALGKKNGEATWDRCDVRSRGFLNNVSSYHLPLALRIGIGFQV